LNINPLDTNDKTVVFYNTPTVKIPVLGDKVRIYQNPGIKLNIGDLVSYKNNVYIVDTSFTPTNKFELGYLSLYDASLLENANDRVIGYYNPSRNGFDKDPGQIFYGIVYPGVNVRALRFKEYNNIYDGSGFDDVAFDNWKYSDVLVISNVFTGDGSTTTFVRDTYEDVVEVRINGNLQTEYADYTLTYINKIRSVNFAFAPITGSEIVIYTREKFLDEEPFVDINVTSNFTDTSLGIDVDSYTFDGGKFIDEINSHGPEELVTGITFDTLDITCITVPKNSTTAYGFRIFKDMRNIYSYYGLREASVTYLLQDLNFTDTTIYLNDVSVLTAPTTDKPGVLFVNGERIEFLSLDPVENTVSQLRRGTSGTGASNFISATRLLPDSTIGHTVVTDAGITVKMEYKDSNRIDTHITQADVVNYTLNQTSLIIDGSTVLLQSDQWLPGSTPVSVDYNKMFIVYYGGILLEYGTDYDINIVDGNRILTLKIDKVLSGKYLTIVKKDGNEFVAGDIYQPKTNLGTQNIVQDFSSLVYSVTGELQDYLYRS